MILLDNVTKTYGPVRALVGVSCTFRPGSITTLRGPNGSGKSTLLTIIGTMTRPTSGRIDHGDLGAGHRKASARSLGWVGHESLCYPDLTGRENIELAASLHGCDPRRAFALAAGSLRAARLREPARPHLLRAASGSASPSPERSSSRRASSCSTNRRQGSTQRRRPSRLRTPGRSRPRGHGHPQHPRRRVRRIARRGRSSRSNAEGARPMKRRQADARVGDAAASAPGSFGSKAIASSRPSRPSVLPWTS